MLSCLLLWLTARGAAAEDGYDVGVFTHLSGLDANSSCSLVSLTRTDGCYNLAAREEHTESGDQWCHTEVANDTGLFASPPKEKNLVYTLREPEQVIHVLCRGKECSLYRSQPSNLTFFKTIQLNRKNIFAFAFSSSKQRLYFCTYMTSRLIISTDFDGANEKIHVQKMRCFCIAIDDINSFVFFVAHAKPIKITSRLTADGYEIVKNMVNHPFYIAVHPGTKTLFVTCFRKILSFDYNGNHCKQLWKESGIFSLAVNPIGDALYFGTGRGLISLDLKTLAKFDMPISFPKKWWGARYMVYANNSVIVSCTGRPYVVTVDLKTNDFEAKPILEQGFRAPLFTFSECKPNC